MKKGQIDFPLITIAVLIVLIILIAPIVLKILNTFQTAITPAFANITGGEMSSQTANYILGTGANFMDGIMIFLFFTWVIVLIVSSIMIDTHPFWIFLYIIMALLLVVTIPNVTDALDVVYESANFSSEVAQLQGLGFIRDHYGEILVGLMVLTGVLMYGKLSFFKNMGGQRE